MSTLPVIDDQPPRVITLYVPATLALLAGVCLRPGCVCTWSERIGDATISDLFSFVFLWPVVLAFYHGFCFVRSLFQRHPPAGPNV